MKAKTEKNSSKEEQVDWNTAADSKAGAVDQIKKKYGFSSAGVSIHCLPANHLLSKHSSGSKLLNHETRYPILVGE